nr:MAG TPA: EB module protein [Caudoviricetes sp.]
MASEQLSLRGFRPLHTFQGICACPRGFFPARHDRAS